MLDKRARMLYYDVEEFDTVRRGRGNYTVQDLCMNSEKTHVFGLSG